MARNAKAYEVPDQDALRSEKPGAYAFMLNESGERMGIVHNCPCGCGSWSAMWFEGVENAGGPKWSVKGEWPKVTLSPSIGIGRDRETGQFHWHGFLEDGVFVER